MTDPKVELAIEDRAGAGLIARLVIDHQAKLNILNTPLIEQLTATVSSLRERAELRALILTGAGDHAFIGGADINEMAGLDEDGARAFITRLHGACLALRELPVPVIARISGYCLGAGLELAAACDLRVAAEHSQFGMPEVGVGIPSVIEAALLPRLIGWGKTAELVLTGELIAATEALRCGLIERLAPLAELDQAVERWVAAILQAGPGALRLQKRLLRQWEQLPLDQAIESGIETFAEAYCSDEPRVLMERFRQRHRNS
jgi:enoyl-CoA hydratase/carnithine racemase